MIGDAIFSPVYILIVYQDGEIQRLRSEVGAEAGAEDQLHEQYNFLSFKYQLLIDMVRMQSY